MKKSIVLILLVLSAQAVLFAGGGSESSGPQEIRFGWWGGNSRHEATLAAVELYNASQDQVTVIAEYGSWKGYYEKLVTQLAGKTAPDLIQISVAWFVDFAQQGDLLVDLNTIDSLDLSIFDSDFLETECTYDGKLQGLPTGLTGETLIYNTEFFDRFGINPNTEEWTWEKLIEEGTRINAEDPDSYLLITRPGIVRHYLRQLTGTNTVNDDYTLAFTREQAVEMFNLLKRLYDSGTVVPLADAITSQQPDEHPKWQQGRAGMFATDASILGKIKSNSPFPVDVARYPVVPASSNTGIVVKPPQLFSVNTFSDKQEATLDFLDYLFTDEQAILALGSERGVPPTAYAQGILNDNGKMDAVISKAVDIALNNKGDKVNSPSNTRGLYQDIMYNVLEKVVYGELEPEPAADELIERYLRKIEEIKSEL